MLQLFPEPDILVALACRTKRFSVQERPPSIACSMTNNKAPNPRRNRWTRISGRVIGRCCPRFIEDSSMCLLEVCAACGVLQGAAVHPRPGRVPAHTHHLHHTLTTRNTSARPRHIKKAQTHEPQHTPAGTNNNQAHVHQAHVGTRCEPDVWRGDGNSLHVGYVDGDRNSLQVGVCGWRRTRSR